MIIMTVCKYQTADVLFFICQIPRVGDYQINSVHVSIGKPDTAVDNQNILHIPVIAQFIRKHVFCNVARSADRNNADLEFTALLLVE